MFVGKLTKISNNVNALRTTEVFGNFDEMPVVGGSFVIFSESLTLDEPGAIRRVWTSEITVVDPISDTDIVFTTLNSLYKLSEIKKVEDANGGNSTSH